jgi:ParB family chromosome partitioning protein
VLVRPRAGGFELIAGERRTRAARAAGLSHVPAIVLQLEDRDALEIAIMENLQREDLNAVEETEAVLLLLELSLALDREQTLALLQEVVQELRGRTPAARYSDAQRAAARELFERLGRFSVASFVANRVPILRFPPELLEAVRQGQLEFTKAQALARIDDPRDRERLLREAIGENLSLSQIRRRITELRADQPTPRSVHDRVLESAHSARRALQRQHLAKLPPERLEAVEALLANLLDLFEEPEG